MSNSLDNSQNLKTIINPVDLGFIPIKFWKQREISISDFNNLLTNTNSQEDSQSKEQQFSKFNHKLWCVLRITTIYNGLFDLFGAKWKDNTKLIIEINKSAFSNFFAKKNQENFNNLFQTNGWQKIDNNDTETLLFTIDEKNCLNNELFDIDFYEQLIKFGNESIIEKLSDLLSKSLLSVIQNENVEKSINYSSKSSEFITLDNINDDLILDDVVHFVTFPGEIILEQTKQDKGNIKKIFKKIGKDQLLFDESSFDTKYQGINVVLDLPPFDRYSLFPISKEFSQSIITINSMIVYTAEFKKMFFEKLIELSQKIGDSRIFFEFISVVIILLKSHQFDLESYDPIFMSMLFDDYATVYNYSEDYQKLLFLREQWIDLSFGFNENMMNIFKREFPFFKNIFTTFRTHPIGFSEFTLIVSRIFPKLTAEPQDYIMLLMAQTNIYYLDCMKSILLNNIDNIKNDQVQLNNHFAYQQMMNVRKLFNFDCRAQFDINFNQLNIEDKKKVNAIIQARFSILTFFYKNLNVIFKCDQNHPLNTYQYKTLKLFLSFSFEISLQKQTLSLIDSNEYFYNNSNNENGFSFFEQFCQVYFKMFNKKANDIITVNFCDNLINHMHNKIYKILSKGINKDSNEISWINFLVEIFPNIIYWYSLIDINFVPIDMIQLSICNTISFMTSCLYLSSFPSNDFLHEQFEKVFYSLYNDLESICIFYFVNIESCRDLIFKKLLNLAAERELKSIYAHFTIKFGKAIKILLKLFFNESTLSYLNDICYLDIRNCYQLTESGVDILLIDYLYNNRNNENASNRSLITSVLQLAKTLSYQHSSNEFVKKFISIFTPINGSLLPYYLPLFVNTLDDLSMKEARFPVVSVPLLQDNCNLNVFSIDPKIINDGVTFSFWIFINKSITNPRKILIIKQKLETKERKIILIINPNRKFSFIASDDDDNLVGNTKNQISEGKWHFVMISICFRSKELKMRIQSNDSLLYKNKIDDEIYTIMNSFEKDTKYIAMPKSEIGDFSQFFQFTQFDENQKIQVCIGEECKSTNFASNDSNNNKEKNVGFRHIQSEDLITNSNKDILFGPIGMFPLLEDDSEYLYYMFNTVDKIPSKSLFYACPFELSKGVVILKFESDQFNSVSFPIEFEFNSSFINILIKSNLVDKLIVLFGLNYLRKQSNTIRLESLEKSFIFKEADDNFYFDYTNAVIGLFRNIFSISEEAQNEIVNINGFHLISHLLSSTFDETIKVNGLIENKFHSFSLDFFLYKNLVSLFESITIKTAQQQFLSDILFDFELWIKSKDFDLILNHWYTSLIPEFYIEFFNKYTIVSMLTLMRLYLYYEPMEKSIIIPIRKINIEKVKNCIKIFWSIISSSDEISEFDLSIIISHAITCPDFYHVEDIINFISDFFDYRIKLSLSEEKNAINQEVIPQKKKFLQFFQDISFIKNISNTTNASNQTNKLSNIYFQDYNSLLQLTLLISCNNNEIVKKVIVLFIKLYQMQLLNNISYEDYFDLICMNLQIFKDPDDLLNEFLNYFCPQILSLCIVIAIQANSDESLIKVIEKMETFENLEKFCVSKNWFLWPVISCFMRPKCSDRMIEIFVKFHQSEWPKIYNTMLIVGRVMNIDSKKFLHYFISRISSILCINYDDSKANVFFMMAFYYLFISFDSSNNNKYNSKVDTQEIIKRIMSLDEFYQSISFKIELDDHDCLVNADVAQVALSLFEIKHSKIYSDFIVILSAYQLYFEKSPLEKFKKFNCITKSDAFYYYDAIALKLKKDLLTKEDPQKIYLNHEEYMKNFVSKFDSFFTPLNTNVFLKYIQSNLQEIDYKYKVFLNDRYHNMSSHLVKNYADHLQMMKISFKKQWDLFWLSNSKENDSIFHYNIQTDNSHFKRDNSNCFYYCPFKLAKNKQFNDHLKESLFRDLGNIEKAEIQCQQIKSENKTNENELFKIDTTNEIKSKKEHIFELRNDENIIYQTNECERRKPDESYFVTFIIFTNKLKIGNRIILLEEIKSVFLRYVQQRQTAIEIFLANGKSYFLNFPNILNSYTIVSKIQQAVQISNPSPYSTSIIFQSTCSNQFFFESNQFTQKWINGEMSNFEYLMMINIYCGRTFNDAKFYPVMPWIIQDYDSNELNLNDPNIFRDLSLPIGAINEKRFNMLYKSFKASKNPETLFLYSSWLICPLSLCVWLVRLEPFTTNHIKMQSGKFDVEQRIFHSIKAAYELCTHDNNDFRELIPEFFFQPEFLVNMNKFDLGETMKLNNSSDVELPKWAKTPFEFIYKHRKALECDIVSENLNKWIDLIFGCNQNNESFKNVYRGELYSDVWETEFGKEPRNAERIRCSLDLLGQIPHPLFNSPHPKKNILTAEEMMKKCDEKLPSNEFELSIEKDLDINENQSIEIKNNTFIIYSILINENDVDNGIIRKYLYVYCLQFVFIDSNQKKFTALTYLLKYEMKPNSIDFISSSLLFVEPFESEIKSLNISSNFIKNISKHGFALTIGSCVYLTFNLLSKNIENQKKFKITNEIGCIFEKVAVCSLYLAAINSDSNTLYIFNQRMKNERDSLLFKIYLNDYVNNDSINCIAISDVFHLCVCCTKNKSSIIIVSLNKGDVERVVPIENEGEIEIPQKILITSSWGFILVLTSIQNKNENDSFIDSCYRFHLFNINGYFIGKSGLFKLDNSRILKPLNTLNLKSETSLECLNEAQISQICSCKEKENVKFICWKSFDGFDFVLMADSHSVYNFEAFEISKAPGEPILTFSNEIIGLDFIEEAMKIIVTLDNGKVVISNIMKK